MGQPGIDPKLEAAIVDALDSDDPALIRFDAPELRAAVAQALVEFRQIASDIAEMIGPLEARIAALEAKLNKDGTP